MVNQQLKDYIDEQIRVGVSRDAIKSALLEAGWNFSEVNEAMGPGAQQPPRMDAVKPAMPAVSVAASNPVAVRPQVQPAVRNPQPVVTQSQPVSSPRVMPATNSKPMANISTVSAGIPSLDRPVRKGHRLVDLVMGFLIFILGLAAASFFVKSSSLSSALGLAESDKATVAHESASIRAQNQTLQAEKEVLTAERDDFASQLGVLVSPRLSGEEPVAVKGVLGVSGDKAPYTIRTSAGLVVTLKNSRDAVIEPILKQLLGTAISVSGTHQVGSKDVIVKVVNGVDVAPAPATSSSSPAVGQ